MPHNLEIIDGKLYAYGDNGLGQLGVGHNRVVDEKVLVLTKTDKDSMPWISFATGRFHSVAVKQDNSIWVWGDNRFGQVAQNTSISYLSTPTKLDTPRVDPDKKIEIRTGLYFTIYYQYFDKAYGFGEFQNFDTDFAIQYRQIVELKSPTILNEWLSIQTSSKTIVGLSSQGGYTYSDWSGELFTKKYDRFENLKVGDIFTLYDPNNRNRVLYKKIKTFSKGPGCCSVNALCLHRMYRELVSNIPPNVLLSNNNQISVYDVLDQAARDKYEKTIVSSREKYRTDFVFDSVLSRQSSLSKYKGLDPWTLNALFLMTDSKNLLDFILYDGLFFSDNTNDLYNKDTVVEIISAKEIFQPYAGIGLPPYLLKKTGHEVKFSSFTLGQINRFASSSYFTGYGMENRKILSVPFSENTYPDTTREDTGFPYLYKKDEISGKSKRFVFTSRYGFGYPLYQNSEGKLTDFDTGKIYYNQTSQLPGCIYCGSPKYIREIEKDDSVYDLDLVKHIVDLPVNENGEIISVKNIINDPYLIKMSMDNTNNVFQQSFNDPTRRIKTKYDGNIEKTIDFPENDPMMFYISVYKAPEKVFYIGKLVKTLIENLLKKDTDARDVENYFGISKASLSSMWKLITEANPYNKDGFVGYTSDQKFAFAKLSGLFYNKLKDQPLLDDSGLDVLKTGVKTISTDQFFDYETILQICSSKWQPGVFASARCIGSPATIGLPYLGVPCWTDRTDRSKLLIFGNYLGSFKSGKTSIRYQTWSGNENTTKNGQPTITTVTSGGISVTKYSPDAYQENISSVDIVDIFYDESEFITILQLKNQFLNNYLMGNLIYASNPYPSIYFQAIPFIHFNYILTTIDKLKSVTAPLKI